MHRHGGTDFVSAHTIEANIGIYTMPGTQPSYLAIGEFGVGTADPNATSINGSRPETQDRIFLEAETTDVKTAGRHLPHGRRPDDRRRAEPLGDPFEMTGENQAAGRRVPRSAAASRRRSPAPSRNAPGCGRPRRRSGCSASRRGRSASPCGRCARRRPGQ